MTGSNSFIDTDEDHDDINRSKKNFKKVLKDQEKCAKKAHNKSIKQKKK